jgi:hypothetical protein
VAAAVGVPLGRDASAVGVSVVGGGGVAVRMKGGVGDCEQEVTSKRKRKEERMRDVMCLGMAGILTEMSVDKFRWLGQYTSLLTEISSIRFLRDVNEYFP